MAKAFMGHARLSSALEDSRGKNSFLRTSTARPNLGTRTRADGTHLQRTSIPADQQAHEESEVGNE